MDSEGGGKYDIPKAFVMKSAGLSEKSLSREILDQILLLASLL